MFVASQVSLEKALNSERLCKFILTHDILVLEQKHSLLNDFRHVIKELFIELLMIFFARKSGSPDRFLTVYHSPDHSVDGLTMLILLP